MALYRTKVLQSNLKLQSIAGLLRSNFTAFGTNLSISMPKHNSQPQVQPKPFEPISSQYRSLESQKKGGKKRRPL